MAEDALRATANSPAPNHHAPDNEAGLWAFLKIAGGGGSGYEPARLKSRDVIARVAAAIGGFPRQRSRLLASY